MTTEQEREWLPLYAAIGDSLTVGVGSTFFTPNFVERYRQRIEQAFNRPVAVQTFAKNGATTEQILASLSDPNVAQAIGQADIITLTAGGNDLIKAGKEFLRTGNTELLQYALSSGSANIEQIIQTIHMLNPPAQHPYIIRLFNLYNPLPGIPEAAPWIQAFNRQLAGFKRFPHIEVVDLYHIFLGHEAFYLSFDHIHPNPRGYEAMADAAAQLGYGSIGQYAALP